MGRVERKRLERARKKHPFLRILCIIGVFLLLMKGIDRVDDSFRYMMMIEEPQVFGHKKVNTTIHQIYILGESLYIDEKKVVDTYTSIKNGVQIFLKEIRNKQNQVLKNYEPSY